MTTPQLPKNVQDLLMDDCARKIALEGTLRNQFLSFGYREVSPAGLEYYDTYASGIGAHAQEDMIKTLDHTGRILVLRPDFTTAIARIAATKLLSEVPPLRICYIGSAYADPKDKSAKKQAEFTQAGIELLGCDDPKSDAEAVLLALEAMKNAGLSNYMIEIGQVDFFKGLMEEAGLDSETAEKVRSFVEEKNMLAIDLLLSGSGEKEAVSSRIRELPMLFGGRDVLEKAAKLTDYPKCLSALRNLGTIYDMVCSCGYAEHISIDLGMVHSIGYYTGMIFQGISASLGQPLLSGGRYDELLSQFGRPMSAVGFAMNLECLLEALDAPKESGVSVDVLILAGKQELSRTFSAAQSLRAAGKTVELVFETDEEKIQNLLTARHPGLVLREVE